MKYLYCLTAALIAQPALAQDSVPDAKENGADEIVLVEPLPPVVLTVVGSGQRQRVVDTGQSIAVIGRGEIEAVQGPDLSRVLERLPGVAIARSGPLGSQTSLFVRGASSEQTVVVLDGVRLTDVAAPSGGFDYGTLLTGGIDKIELLRGSNSVVFGSDAIGGVLALTSADINGVRASAEYGANETLSLDGVVGIGDYRAALTVTGGYTRTDGISAYNGGTEPDGFEQWHAGLRGRVQVAEGLNLTAAGRYADSSVDFDGYAPPTYAFGDTAEYQTTRQGSGRIGFDYQAGATALIGGVAYSDTRRAYFDRAAGPASSFDTAGRSWRADFSGKVRASDAIGFVFGGDSEWTRFSTTFDPQRDARLSGGYLMAQFEGRRLALDLGARLTDHDRFGSKVSLGANGRFDLGRGWRLRASFGEGFKAPTLYQLYGYGGNVALRPETSTAVDAGIEWNQRNGGPHVAVTLFRRDSSNLIDYVWPSGYFNVGRTRAEGFEIEAAMPVSNTLAVRGAFSHVKAVNRATGTDLARRPRDVLTASADWRTPLAGLKLGADVRLAGDSFDDPGNFVPLDGYAVVTLRAALPVGDNFELYGRIENVTDARYQTVAGYGTYGRSAYAGLRARW